MEKIEVKRHFKFIKYGSDKEGNIYNVLTNRVLKQRTDKYGYLTVGIRLNRKSIQKRSNRFVYECFNGIIENKNTIDHKNGFRSDNSILNLQSVSQAENIKNKYKNGYIQHDIHAKKLLCIDVLTNEKNEFKSIYNAGKKLNIVPASINRVCRGFQKCAVSKIDNKKYSFKLIN